MKQSIAHFTDNCRGRVKDSYGVGTQITCDVNNAQPSNIVIKLTKCRITEMREWHDCIKPQDTRLSA